jgi:hypothetical protein
VLAHKAFHVMEINLRLMVTRKALKLLNHRWMCLLQRKPTPWKGLTHLSKVLRTIALRRKPITALCLIGVALH